MKRKIIKFSFIFIVFGLIVLNPLNVEAATMTCDSLLGDPTDPDSVAWLVQEILNYVKVIGPLLVLVLSSIDFAKAIIMSDDDNLKKSQKKLIGRILAMFLLYFVPVIASALLDLFGITSCTV